MQYDKTSDLPQAVRNVLPERAQDIYRAAYNHAWDEYGQRDAESREEVSHKVAWSAVKDKYEKDKMSGRWVEKGAD